jgi:hypothetical protein
MAGDASRQRALSDLFAQQIHGRPSSRHRGARGAAGKRTDVLARVAGSWAGYYRDETTRSLCDVLVEIDGAADWVGVGQARRGAEPHTANLTNKAISQPERQIPHLRSD